LKDENGYIKIDGEQIDNLGLHVLRKGLCIIPQDSFVFSGTLKFNVDPYNDYDDELIYDTLEKYRIFESLKNASDSEVSKLRKKLKK
jgi:ATP-binding cassette subfamily C (CFTR/MRP) protein 4